MYRLATDRRVLVRFGSDRRVHWMSDWTAAGALPLEHEDGGPATYGHTTLRVPAAHVPAVLPRVDCQPSAWPAEILEAAAEYHRELARDAATIARRAGGVEWFVAAHEDNRLAAVFERLAHLAELT